MIEAKACCVSYSSLFRDYLSGVTLGVRSLPSTPICSAWLLCIWGGECCDSRCCAPCSWSQPSCWRQPLPGELPGWLEKKRSKAWLLSEGHKLKSVVSPSFGSQWPRSGIFRDKHKCVFNKGCVCWSCRCLRTFIPIAAHLTLSLYCCGFVSNICSKV